MKRPLYFYVLGYIAYLFVRVLYATYRFRHMDAENRLAAVAGSPHGTYVLGCWHQNVFASTLSQVGIPYCPLASQSKDGDMTAFVMQKLGFTPVRGSSSRGGSEGRRLLIENLHHGNNTALTVDGPKGPKGVVKPGVIDVALKAGVPIMPMTAVADRYWVLHKSWDHFRLPKPFARIAVRYAPPITLPKGLDGEAFEAAQAQVATILNGLDEVAIADTLAARGHYPPAAQRSLH